jgi:putative transposase
LRDPTKRRRLRAGKDASSQADAGQAETNQGTAQGDPRPFAKPTNDGSDLIRSPKTGPFKARVFRDIFPWLEERKTMKASQFSDARKAFILKQGNDGVPVADICRKAGISQATYLNWKKKYDGMQPPEMRRLKQLEDENARLKKIVADLSLDREMLQDVIRRKI